MPPKPRSLLHARIGRRIRLLREARSLTQAALASQIGCSNHFISGIERGVDSPSLLTVERLAAALETTVAALVVDEEEARTNVGPLYEELLLSVRGKEDPELFAVLRAVAGLYRPNATRPRLR